ncbi:unnamed protein product [Victoria cruziana]
MICLQPAFLPLPKTKATTPTNRNVGIDDHLVFSILEDRPRLVEISQAHAFMIKKGLVSDPNSMSRLLTSCVVSQYGSLDYALKVFEGMPQPNLYMWNIIIRGYASGSNAEKSILLFSDMLGQGMEPNKFTFPFVIKACSEVKLVDVGTSVHGLVVKSGFDEDVYINNSLIHFYASCGNLEQALQVFVKSPQRDIVSWNTMITGYTQSQRPDAALELFRSMQQHNNVKANDLTMLGVITACSQKGDLDLSRWVHSYMKRNEISMSLVLCNAMLDMYGKCGDVAAAERLFDNMPVRDTISWTSLILAYAKIGDFVASQRLFDCMPVRDIAAWNAMIAAYEQGGRPKDALACFRKLQKTKLKPDSVTFVSGLSACAQLGMLDSGKWIHELISKQGVKLNFYLATALIDMYSKCGDLDGAVEVFHSAKEKDIFVWSAMIAGHAMHGHGDVAIDIFMKMQDAGVKPNEVTFTNLLSACSHSGLVNAGRNYFHLMLPIYGIEPKIEHYGCMVDMLGRAGLLKEAVELINSMPITHISVWGALLGGCMIYSNVELGEHACARLLELDPSNDGAYVMLSNIYAKAGKWDEVTRMRKLMKDIGLTKEPGCSSIEVDGVIHEFLVGDTTHPLSDKIYLKLDEVASRLKLEGYVPNTSELLQYIEDDNVKEQALYLHSEKLAIAYGLISTTGPAPIRIVKNLRICNDCHCAAKFISTIYNREILLRDRYRFHHFKEGVCSCQDYW